MPVTDKLTTKEIVIGVGLIVIFALAMLLVLNSYRNEGEKRSAVISEEERKTQTTSRHSVKLLAVDPVKGDATARLEFIPHGTFAKEDGTLTQNLKLYINSATGKQEHDFQKGKRMNPVEAVISMYDGLVTDYPFDQHSGFLELYFTPSATTTTSQTQGATGSAPTPTPRTDTAPTPSAEAAPSPTDSSTPGGEGAKSAAESKEPEDSAATSEEDVH